ncbi:hypothetical protein ACFOWE_07485 [Planomonospora corallina]|uniref:Uncharacterized protein n=1 Tax=Planomonospora corallina TaxID=1806052 RepID=A0ABV8I1T1_9ACTN
MKWMSWLGAGLLVAALVAAGVSVLAFSRAAETQERLESHLAKAGALLKEAESVKEADPARHEELKQEAGRYTSYAESDGEEHAAQRDGARYLAAGAVAGLAGGGALIIIGRRRAAGGPVPRGT